MMNDIDEDWWKNSVIYHIYLPAFKDGNGDGVGDFKGLISEIDYLDYLKVKVVMISPFYPSPMKDNGYDVSSYTEIDPMYGNMEDFDAFMRAAKSRGISVIIDLVFNHTSDQHEWFKKSVKKLKPYDDYYIWIDPVIKNGERSPPSNWISVFGGSMWQWSEERNQFYLHQFLLEQPDLNLRNKDVRHELEEIIKFWLDKGVDGFRIDAVSHLFEDELLRDEPRSGCKNLEPDDYYYHTHVYTTGQPENLTILKEWRGVMNEYSKKTGKYKLLLTENVESLELIKPYFGTQDKTISDIPFYFRLAHLRKESTGRTLLSTVKEWIDTIPEGKSANWILGDHDFHRMASRVGPDMVDGILMIAFLLPGVLFTYYGDELTMEDVDLKLEQMKDSFALRTKAENSRDPARTPMQWNSSANAGFTEHKEPWLPVHENFKKKNVENLKKDPFSTLQIFRKLMDIRKDIVIANGLIEYPYVDGNIFSYIRVLESTPTAQGLLVIVNFGSCCCIVDLTGTSKYLPGEGQVQLTNASSLIRTTDENVKTKYTKYHSQVIMEQQKISLKDLFLFPKQGIIIKFQPKIK